MSAKQDQNLSKILDAVKDLTEGKWNHDIEVDHKGMIGEMAKYINQTLKNLRQLDKNLGENMVDTPKALSEAQVIIDQTEKATIRVLDQSENILGTALYFKENIAKLKKADAAEREKILEEVDERANSLEQNAYDLISSMEFQDITQQKITSIAKALENIEHRLVDLLIIFKIQSNSSEADKDVELLKSLHDNESRPEATQDLVDQLLAEFGI